VRIKGRWVAKGLAIALAIVAFIAVFAWVVMWLWNALVPQLFHGPQLGYWQAVGLMILSRILFGGIRGHRGHGSWRDRFRERWIERWEQMTPEEREQLRTRFSEHRGRHRCAREESPPPPARPGN
jgi:hypothetical protein